MFEGSTPLISTEESSEMRALFFIPWGQSIPTCNVGRVKGSPPLISTEESSDKRALFFGGDLITETHRHHGT